MNKFNKAYLNIISQWNFTFSKDDKTKLKQTYLDDPSIQVVVNPETKKKQIKKLSVKQMIEKFIDYSDTDWKWDQNLSNAENVINLYRLIKNDPDGSSRRSFLYYDCLTDQQQQQLQQAMLRDAQNKQVEKYIKLWEKENHF